MLVAVRGERPKLPDHVPATVKALIEAMWAQDREERPSAQEVRTRSTYRPLFLCYFCKKKKRIIIVVVVVVVCLLVCFVVSSLEHPSLQPLPHCRSRTGC